MLEIIEDTLIDAIKLLPFLFITYYYLFFVRQNYGYRTL